MLSEKAVSAISITAPLSSFSHHLFSICTGFNCCNTKARSAPKGKRLLYFVSASATCSQFLNLLKLLKEAVDNCFFINARKGATDGKNTSSASTNNPGIRLNCPPCPRTINCKIKAY